MVFFMMIFAIACQILIFLIFSCFIEGNIFCTEKKQKVLPFCFWELWPLLPMLGVFGLYFEGILEIEIVFWSIVITVTPLVLLYLIIQNSLCSYLYGFILRFIRRHYTMIYVLLAIFIVILPSCHFDYKVVSSIYLSLNRFTQLALLYDGPTIIVLQHVFCCRTNPATTPMQKGVAAAVTAYGLCKTDMGKLVIGNLNQGFHASLNEHSAKLAFAANDSSLANGSQTKQQHSLNNQTLLNKYYLKGPGPTSVSAFNNGLVKSDNKS